MAARSQHLATKLAILLALAMLAGCASVGEAVIHVPPRTGTGTTSSAPQPYPERVAAAYSQIYADSKAPPLAGLPGPVNVVNLAFAAGTPLALVGNTPQGSATMVRDLTLLRAQGVRVVLSIGGASGTVDTSDRAAFVDRVMAINQRIPLDGIDWDIEHSAIDADDIVAISGSLVQRRGPAFAVTLAPNGSTVDAYLPIAKQLQDRGILSMISQQFYDAEVSTDDAVGQVRKMRAAGIDENRIGIGMMVGGTSKYWTIDECLDAANTIRRAYPGVRGGFLWETSRPGTAEWSAMVAPILTSPTAR